MGSISRLSPTPSDERQTRRHTPTFSMARTMFRVPSDRTVFFVRAGPESRHHGLLTLQGLFHRSDIHDVALNRLEIRVLDLELGGITRKRPDSVPSGESLLDQLATNATC